MEKVVRQAMQPTTTPAIPQSFAEALRLAAAQAEQIERQQKQIEADAPRVLFSQAVETAKQSVLIGELAKIICQNGVQTGEKRLFQWMRDNGYLALLTELGFEVINPLKNGLAAHEEWIKHLCKDIELLHSCDAIYMMDNWTTSTGASIEFDFANRTGKDVLFESNIIILNDEYKAVMRIQNAIHEVTGLRFNQYITKSRKREGVLPG